MSNLDNHTDSPSTKPRAIRIARGCPPYNPELHEMTSRRQAGAVPMTEEACARGFQGWHQRGYLPHRDVPGLTQFVTIRLCDSMPANRRSEWDALFKLEDDRERRKQLEAYLDQGLGECWLRQPKIAAIAENALRFFDGQRYALQAWVIMPNHLHVLVDVWDVPLAKIIQSWKGFTARHANLELGRTGAFWEREYWDTYMRDAKQKSVAVRYIENNPVNARLARSPVEWQWSSARWRDKYGRLVTA